MNRVLIASLFVLVGTLSTGCRSCSNPYDYSSPVANCGYDSCNSSCGGRAGSVLSGGTVSHESYGETIVSEEPVLAEPQIEQPYDQ